MSDFPIVGIGSSAGGLDPLQKLFRAMPDDSGMAFVLAAHLDPTHESHLAELISRCTKMQVVEVKETTKVAADHVYVITPDQQLTIRKGKLETTRPTAPRGQRHPVDAFFRSLAEDQGERAIAIVLSGTGTNGSQGLRFIKAEGGVAIAQEPETAEFDGMPRSAIGTGIVDIVLPPEKMPETLLRIANHTYVRQPEKVIEEGAPEEGLDELLALIRAESRQDFSSYKKATLWRRILRRMGLRQSESLKDYIEMLRGDPEEVAALVADLTINVTGFFRDPEGWQELDERVIQPLVHERASGSTIRAWVPGCSTGEEAYSIAMLVDERAEEAGKTFDLRVFATDVAGGVLSTARSAMYPASIEADIGRERLERFFEREDDTYHVRKSLREAITVAPQNLLQDPPFSRLDLISCRNLLIYLKPETQQKVLRLFHFTLRQGGHLFLGSAEAVSGVDDLYETVSKKWRIYRRLGPTRHDLIDFPLADPGEKAADDSKPAPVDQPHVNVREIVKETVLRRHAPACALIDRENRVRYLLGPTERYLQPASGEPSNNLFSMTRKGLEAQLRKVVGKAIEENREVSIDARVRRDETLHPVRIVVTPVRPEPGGSGFLVCFLERESSSTAERGEAPAEETDGRRDGGTEEDLQAELDATREDLRLTIEQLESANEELQASNEEIRSINEELKASNEELETSKEELQSLNEELNTVNSQLQAKVQELEARTDDLNNLLNSTDIATLFLDRQFRIRWFTPSMRNLISLRSGDIDRPISDFSTRIRGGDLIEEARGVLESLTPRESEVENGEGRWYIRRMLPYRTGEDRIDGVVVSFIDITERKHAAEEVARAKIFAESIIDTVRTPLIVLNPDLIVQSANAAFFGSFGVSREETEDRGLFELGSGQWEIPRLRQLLLEVLPHDKQMDDYEVTHAFPQIGSRTMLLNARQIDSVQRILLSIEDVTERRRAEEAQAEELRAMTALQELGREITRSDDLDALLEKILDGVMRLHEADFGNVQLYDRTTKTLRIAVQKGFEKRFLDHFAEVGANESSACGQALRTGKRIVIEDTEPDPSYMADREEARQAGYRAVQSTPLFGQGGKPLGVLSTHFRDPRRFSERELHYTEVAARLAADAITGRLLQDALEASEERLRKVLETEAVGVLFFDEETGVLTDANDAFLHMTGYTREDVQSGKLSWRSMTPEESIEASEEQFERVAKTGRTGPYEKECLLKDGSRSWMLFAGRSLGDGTVAQYAVDISERKRAERERELLTRELSHRVKNTLAVVQSLARMTNGKITSVEGYREAFLGRLQALARAQSLLLGDNWQGADLKELVEETVNVFQVSPEMIVVEGEPASLTAERALGLSLMLHELGTNAVKYGSLSGDQGRLRVAWTIEAAGEGHKVRLIWQERGGAPVEPPSRTGFGTELIDQTASYELDGEAKLDFAPEGLTCEITFPLE